MTEAKFLTAEQYDFIYEKYHKLFKKIAATISGDNSLSPEDIEQEMMMVANRVVQSFKKKFPDKNFDDYKNSLMFHKFLKTSLWNFKNTVGLNAKRRKKFIPESIERLEEDNPSSLQKTDSRFSSMEDLELIEKLVNSNFSELISTIIKNPDLIENSGRINVTRLALVTSRTLYETNKQLKEINKIYGKSYK